MTLERFKRVVLDSVEAIQYTGENIEEIESLVGGKVKKTLISVEIEGEHVGVDGILILAPVGFRSMAEGDYIVRGSHGELFKCDGDTFHKEFDPINLNEDTQDPPVHGWRCPDTCNCLRSHPIL